MSIVSGNYLLGLVEKKVLTSNFSPIRCAMCCILPASRPWFVGKIERCTALRMYIWSTYSMLCYCLAFNHPRALQWYLEVSHYFDAMFYSLFRQFLLRKPSESKITNKGTQECLMKLEFMILIFFWFVHSVQGQVCWSLHLFCFSESKAVLTPKPLCCLVPRDLIVRHL